MKYLYVLLLEHGKYFVGRTKKPNYFQIEDFYKNNDYSLWTLKYRPVDVVEIITIPREEYEYEVMMQIMENYGINNVRGLMYSEIKLTDENIENLKKSKVINNEKKHCYICCSYIHNAIKCKKYIDDLKYKCYCIHSEIYPHRKKYCSRMKYIELFDDEYDEEIMQKIINE